MSGTGVPDADVPACPPADQPSAPDETATVRQIAERAEELNGSLNLRRTLLRLFDLLRPAVADWAMLVMSAGQPGGLTLYGGNDATFTARITRTSTERLSIDRVLRSGQTELLHVGPETDDAASPDDGLGGLIPHLELRAQAAALRPADVLGLPLTARGSTIGVLTLVRGGGRGFRADEVALAEQIAARAALALDSAQLYEDRNHVASVLQTSLRPPSLPEIPGARVAARFRAAAEHLDIGGDFYDVHGSGEDWLLVLGDVCGKGVEAAVLTGRTRQSIRTAAHFDRSPDAVLAALNSVLHDAESDRFVTVACARLRLGCERARVDLAVAGHPAPIIVRADGTVEQADIAGMAAGVLPEALYRRISVSLGAGDTMLMFTDGIDEARGADGFYGMERLLALLPAYAGAGPDVLCEAVEQNVIEYLDGRAHDDIALLALTYGR
jgi:sigma-B regulation protein RsbU (phosphoserine phosphatase)